MENLLDSLGIVTTVVAAVTQKALDSSRRQPP